MMGNEFRGKVIKPPIEMMSSGKVFKPSTRFRNKIWLIYIVISVILWAAVNFGYLGIGYLMVQGEEVTIADLRQYWGAVNLVILYINLIWLIPVIILTFLYVNRIEYSVIAESGEVMPEIYVKKGLFNVSRKHVPFRTITNISSRTGIFDRLFRIGTVEIETAGIASHRAGKGPEEKIEGIMFYEEVRDFILTELRKFRSPYTTGTEVVRPHEETAPRTEGFDAEILSTLREIREILRNQSK